jgi:putative endopeptidase
LPRNFVLVASLLALPVAAGAAETAAPAADAAFVTNARGLDRRNLDTSVSPCTDFYQYANGGWLARNPVPSDQSSWGISSEMRERNYVLLREILDEAAKSNAAAGTNARKVGDYWQLAMDTERLEREGIKPIAGDLARIDALASPADVAAYVRERIATGANAPFGLGVMPDLQDSTRYLLYAVQGGLGLPDQDYYIRTDEKTVELRNKYVTHVAGMLQLLGDSPEAAKAAAESILALETRLAKASLTNVELRNPANFYNLQAPAAADALTPSFSWTQLFREIGLQNVETFSYAHPKFFTELNAALGDAPLAAWKSYLRWQLVNEAAPYLSSTFEEKDFDFYQRTLQGTQAMRPRWKRMVDETSAAMGEALGEVYVARAFPPTTKARADRMIEDLRNAARVRLQNLAWMSPETKTQALAKLSTFGSKIGYPDTWRDYSSLSIGRDSLLANHRAAAAFETRRGFAKIGKPIDRGEWGLSPQTINAYYNPLMNEIAFPAAIMQPPFFDGEIGDAVNYGAMGGVIGHEFMHGYDDQGSQFDAQGNMKNWWSEQDKRLFEERTARLVAQYDQFEVAPGVKVNGQLTLGENIGDLAGVTMAYHALQSTLAGKEKTVIDGFTPEQRFFLSWAQAWRRNYRPEAAELQVKTDVHSPSKFRANGPLTNMPEFAAAFGCKPGDPMVLGDDKRADIW